MANGFPLSAIVGRADVMQLFEDVFFSFTFGGEAVSIAASLAVIGVMEREDVVGHLWRVGERLKSETNRLAAECGLTGRVECVGYAPWTTISFRDADGCASLILRSLFQQEVMRRGVLTHGNHIVSYSHSDEVVDEALAAYRPALEIVADAIAHNDAEQRLVGPPMQAVFRQA
jgi:glutamate-1-semialdehyde 2,1-aminomutase/spore coat polysaccharide biosynthesis protein SpsF